MLLRDVPGARQSRLVRDKLLKIVGNHDDHHHVRLARPSADAEAAAANVVAPP